METLRIGNQHELTNHENDLIKQRGARPCVLSELAVVVTSGHIDHSQLLIVVCDGLNRILDFLRYLVCRLCHVRTGGRKDQWSIESTCMTKPLPDLLKDLPVHYSAHIPRRRPDILKVPDSTGHHPHRAQPRRAPCRRETIQGRLPFGGNRTSRSSMGGSVYERVGMSEPTMDLKLDMVDGKEVEGGVQAEYDVVVAGAALDRNSQCIDDLVVAIRTIGDNLDVTMRNHKEPAVQAVFRNAGTFFGYELLMAFRGDVMTRLVGTTLQVMLFIGRL